VDEVDEVKQEAGYREIEAYCNMNVIVTRMQEIERML